MLPKSLTKKFRGRHRLMVKDTEMFEQDTLVFRGVHSATTSLVKFLWLAGFGMLFKWFRLNPWTMKPITCQRGMRFKHVLTCNGHSVLKVRTPSRGGEWGYYLMPGKFNENVLVQVGKKLAPKSSQ